MPAQLHRYFHVPERPSVNARYRIFDGETHTELEQKVNDAINQGYKPLGSVSVGYKHITEMFFFQAMIFEGFKDASR